VVGASGEGEILHWGPCVGNVVLRRKPLLRHTYLGFFFDPEDIRKLIIGVIWNFAKETGLF
jgi:hypothetical protein